MEDDDRDYRYDCNVNGDAPGFPPPPQSPKPAKSGAFSYDNKNGLRVGGFSHAPLEDLKLLFRKNASTARRAVATKPWITAQLHLYGIAFNKSAKAAELRSTLEAAVKGRMCTEGGPPSITTMREQLVTQFAQNREHYARAVKKHKLDIDQWHGQNFSKLDDPGDEARYDLDLFFSKYFVDGQGLPAPNKTPEPVIIWDLHDRPRSLRDHVDAIPGLEARAKGFLTVIAWAPEFEKGITTAFSMIDTRPGIEYDRPTLEALFDPDHFLAKYFLDGLHGKPVFRKQKTPVILTVHATYTNSFANLSRAAKHVPELLVEATSKPIEEDHSWGREKACVIVGWAKQVIPQMKLWKSRIAQLEELDVKRGERDKEKAILATLKPHIDYIRTHRPPPSGPFTVDQLAGSYIIQCRLIQDDYACELGSMTLDVHAPTSTHGAVAAFNFGLVEGTMLLASSEEYLELLREEQAVTSSDEEEELTDSEHFPVSGKRKAKASQQTGSKNFKRRLGGDRSQNPSRFYLQWAGCDIGTGELALDEDHERTGNFDLDKSGMTARGQFRYPSFFGDKLLVFTLLKIADKPRKQPGAWSSYREGDHAAMADEPHRDRDRDSLLNHEIDNLDYPPKAPASGAGARANVQKPSISRWWQWELTMLIVSLIAFIALIIVLAVEDGKPVRRWGPLTLNSINTILTTVTGSSMTAIVGSALS
ncbi:hypothetical protein E0Z10_g4209 [Xylaria hypoxylon]|uniref:Uncharacterized protein n=1 Tax=Xylaria hypoxylon TaxID=37992 RepID=A0A4Z0YZG9_9PEZI|nr:hypothetical protein E0Z10_g4209 [Xylaria hypoxylon]